MFGFQYILEVFESNPNKVSEDLGIQRQSVYEWIKKKKVPTTRLEQLSKMFSVPKEYFNKDLTEDEMFEIDTRFKNEKVIEFLEEIKSTSLNGEFGYRELDDLIISLYQKMKYQSKDTQLLYRKMNLVKDFIYLLIEDEKGSTIMWEVLDLLSQDIDEFKKDLLNMVEKYIKYL